MDHQLTLYVLKTVLQYKEVGIDDLLVSLA